MRCGVIEGDRRAALGIDVRLAPLSEPQLARFKHADVAERGAKFLSVAHTKLRRAADQRARIPDLTAAFRIQRGVVEYPLPFLTDSQYLDEGAVENQRRHAPGARHPIVSGETGLAGELHRFAQVRTELARGASAAPLCGHGRIETFLVDGKSALPRPGGRQIERESVGVV